MKKGPIFLDYNAFLSCRRFFLDLDLVFSSVSDLHRSAKVLHGGPVVSLFLFTSQRRCGLPPSMYSSLRFGGCYGAPLAQPSFWLLAATAEVSGATVGVRCLAWCSTVDPVWMLMADVGARVQKVWLKSYDSGISAISPGEKKKNRFVKVAGFPGELWWVGASAGKELGQKQVSSVYGLAWHETNPKFVQSPGTKPIPGTSNYQVRNQSQVRPSRDTKPIPGSSRWSSSELVSLHQSTEVWITSIDVFIAPVWRRRRSVAWFLVKDVEDASVDYLSLNRRSGCWRLRRKLVVLQWVIVVWRGAQRLKTYDSGISAISPGEKKKVKPECFDLLGQESLPHNQFVKVAGFSGELWWVGASAGKELGQKPVSSVYGS
ncbi:predicted protein [Arabidopsis lyrata subsp. lyrata]|uniref:Predicted protein n=1 Tax=Arabidopsis lyrata subsp. lyrata TaxID=81972 RepID=D7LB27_ARALL|nr:predicted protein [Arabidopsis lyrata subsp. lyrata]